MAKKTQTSSRPKSVKSTKSRTRNPKSRKHIYFFGNGKADGNRNMKDLLGGKGSGLAEMTNARLPVPPGFTISTEVCNIFYKENRKITAAIDRDIDENVKSIKKSSGAKLDTDLSEQALRDVVERYKAVVEKKTGHDFPQEPRAQLKMARDAVFRSWMNPRAQEYRRIYDIPDHIGTAVNVQMMVFGNTGDRSGTGVGFTRNPATGKKEFYGEFLINAQGEDVVAGIRTPQPIRELEQIMPKAYKQLREITTRLERHYKDVQDFEFTVQDERLFMLQTRSGKRTGYAAVVIATDMVAEKLITPKDAVLLVDPESLNQLLAPGFDQAE